MPTAVQVEALWSGLTDNSGEPLAGGKVYTYSAGTTTPKSLYVDANKAKAATNPVVLDAYGRSLSFGDGAYKFIVKTSADVTLYTIDGLFYMQPSITELNPVDGLSALTINDDLTITGDISIGGTLTLATSTRLVNDIIPYTTDQYNLGSADIDFYAIYANRIYLASLTAGRIPFVSTDGLLTNSSSLQWDAANGRLGAGKTPLYTLHLYKASGADCVANVQGYYTGGGGTGKSALQLDVDGNGGFALQNDASSGTKSFHVIANSGYGASETKIFSITNGLNVGVGVTNPDSKFTVAGDLALIDGMTAPATKSGYAKIYIDTSDGDLKIKFGDGTVKTIMTDT